MNCAFKQSNTSQLSLTHSKFQNKQNNSDWFRAQKDITKILSHFNHLIQSNHQAISSLQNQFTTRATNRSFTKQDITQSFNQDQQNSQCQAPENSMNQTCLTISKQPHSSHFTTSQFNQVNLLTQKLEQIQHQIQQMKRTETQNSFNLQKRLSEKGQKSQIEKALNLSRLLVVQINQIQDRFKENQKTTRIHEDKIKFLEQALNKLDQKLTSQTNIRNSLNLQQKNEKDKIYHQNSILNQATIKSFETRLQEITNKNHIQIQQLKEKMVNNDQEKYKYGEQFNSIYQRIVNLQSHSQQIQTKSQSLIKNIQLQLQNIAKETKKQTQKIKKDTQLQLFKKFDSLDKLYTKKSYFLQEKQENQTEMHKIVQNINKIQNQLNARIQKVEKCHQLTQMMVQDNKSELQFKLNKLLQDQMYKLIQTRQEIEKMLNKYVKTQVMKQFLQQQNQKVHKIMSSNIEQQKQVNEVLCSENILGRWLWQNQQLKNGNLISWDKEVINTLPQNFRFCFERSTLIQISNGGIYKFELGFYSKKKPTIQILINGKVVISAVNSSSYVIHHSSGKLKGIEPTEMSGLTLVDFFLVPEHSRIAIAYSGDVKGEGFINIHRL